MAKPSLIIAELFTSGKASKGRKDIVADGEVAARKYEKSLTANITRIDVKIKNMFPIMLIQREKMQPLIQDYDRIVMLRRWDVVLLRRHWPRVVEHCK